MAPPDLFGELEVDDLEGWLARAAPADELRGTLLWPALFDTIEAASVRDVLQELGVAPEHQMRVAAALPDEPDAARLVSALAAGIPCGLRGRCFVMPIAEPEASGPILVEVTFEAGGPKLARIGLDRFEAALLAFERREPLPASRPAKVSKARRSKASAPAGPITMRRLTASQVEAELPYRPTFPPPGAFPEGTSSRHGPDGHLGIDGDRRVWTYCEGQAVRHEGLRAAGPLQTEVGPGAFWIVRDDGALVRIEPGVGSAIEVVPSPPLFDVCLGPPGTLVTMGRDARLRLVRITDGAIVAELPYIDPTSRFPLHRIQSLPGGRAGICVAGDQARIFGVAGERLAWLDEAAWTGVQGLHARTDAVVALGASGRMLVFGGIDDGLRAAFGS